MTFTCNQLFSKAISSQNSLHECFREEFSSQHGQKIEPHVLHSFAHESQQNRFRSDLEQREIPVSPGAVDLVGFLADNGIVGEWNIQGLPTDMLSTQNGILVTRSANDAVIHCI